MKHFAICLLCLLCAGMASAQTGNPLDVQTLLGVFDALIGNGATVIVIEHDLDVIRNADHIIDMGPEGGEEGGRIIARGTPEEIAADPASITGRFL